MNRYFRKRLKFVIITGLVLIFLYLPQLYTELPQSLQMEKLRTNNKKLEVKHTVFIKVHKAASSTVQNIFFRFGMSRNLTFVLPNPQKTPYENIISLYEGVTKNNILPLRGRKNFDICCCHVIYNRTAFNGIMPEDTKYIGIIRRPFDQFRSSLNYFRPKTLFDGPRQNGSNLSQFLKTPEHPDYWFLTSVGSFAVNRMAFEYNFPQHLFTNYDKEKSLQYLQKLDSELTLVIVVEWLDESLVLMKRMLNWTLKDILYVTSNKSRRKMLQQIMFLPGDATNHRKLARLDYDLYEFFLQRLKKQIIQEGDDFDHEVWHFKTILFDVQTYCWLEEKQSNYVVGETLWNEEFSVNEKDCEQFIAFEIDNIKEIRQRQNNF